ncbi:hypothetical protein BaRGS_00009864 [Batillaria attramentaria]|uniref:Uncharacterized protein n=1 Tax=Batillaria attramentaria TaxID=370345 RepID=A0ABD0LHE6_9CAEN
MIISEKHVLRLTGEIATGSGGDRKTLETPSKLMSSPLKLFFRRILAMEVTRKVSVQRSLWCSWPVGKPNLTEIMRINDVSAAVYVLWFHAVAAPRFPRGQNNMPARSRQPRTLHALSARAVLRQKHVEVTLPSDCRSAGTSTGCSPLGPLYGRWSPPLIVATGSRHRASAASLRDPTATVLYCNGLLLTYDARTVSFTVRRSCPVTRSAGTD